MWFVTFNFQHKDLGNKQITQPLFSRRPLGSTRPSFPRHIIMTIFPVECRGRELSWAANGHSDKIRFKYIENWMRLIKATACFPVDRYSFRIRPSVFFFRSMSALNKFVSSSNTAARKGKQMCKNEIKLDLSTSTRGLKKKGSTTGERHLTIYFSVPGTSFSDTICPIKPVKMDTQVSKHELEKTL